MTDPAGGAERPVPVCLISVGVHILSCTASHFPVVPYCLLAFIRQASGVASVFLHGAFIHISRTAGSSS